MLLQQLALILITKSWCVTNFLFFGVLLNLNLNRNLAVFQVYLFNFLILLSIINRFIGFVLHQKLLNFLSWGVFLFCPFVFGQVFFLTRFLSELYSLIFLLPNQGFHLLHQFVLSNLEENLELVLHSVPQSIPYRFLWYLCSLKFVDPPLIIVKNTILHLYIYFLYFEIIYD